MTHLSTFPPLGNAAGWCKTLAHVEKLARSAVSIITVGSITAQSRDGNPGNPYHQNEQGDSINSLGMPNHGLPYLKAELRQMVEMARAHGKRLAVSIACINEGDLEALVVACTEAAVDVIELNAGCPNVWDGGEQKRILSFDPDGVERSLGLLHTLVGRNSMIELRIKLSPYSDPGLLREVASVLRRYPFITVVTCNTFPNAYMFTGEGRVAISCNKGLGGLGGRAMKPIALGQVAQFREALAGHHIIGAGGIATGRDMQEFIKVGANEAQVGSAFWFTEDLRIFGDILSQYADLA